MVYQDEGDRQVEQKLRRAIQGAKRKLKARAQRSGLYENFGQSEARALKHKFSDLKAEHVPLYGLGFATRRRCEKMLDAFNEWRWNYVPERG